MIDMIVVSPNAATRTRVFVNPAHIMLMRDLSAEQSAVICDGHVVDDGETVAVIELLNNKTLFACHEVAAIADAVELCIKNPGNVYSPDLYTSRRLGKSAQRASYVTSPRDQGAGRVGRRRLRGRRDRAGRYGSAVKGSYMSKFPEASTLEFYPIDSVLKAIGMTDEQSSDFASEHLSYTGVSWGHGDQRTLVTWYFLRDEIESFVDGEDGFELIKKWKECLPDDGLVSIDF